MPKKLRIVHCLRAPVGGLFRHVLDLARAQAKAGHEVGLLADSLTGGPAADEKLAALAPQMALGVTRTPMPRAIGLYDYSAYGAAETLARRSGAHVLHGHGAKGGAYARLAAAKLKRQGADLRAIYTPHGGSLHYAPGTPQGVLFLGLERQLARLSDAIIFESDYSRRTYVSKVGAPRCPIRVIPNGLAPEDFAPVGAAPDAADVLFIGELRKLKGVDVLLDALARTLAPRPATAVIVGSGPDEGAFKDMARGLGLGDRVRFLGAMPAVKAFPLGRLLAVPSRAESFPYVVLEGAAAGLPILASDVGGIPEIVAGADVALLPAGDAAALARKLTEFLIDPSPFQIGAARLKQRVADRFTIARMAADIEALYGEALAHAPSTKASTVLSAG